MPLFFSQQIDEHTKLAVWQITEQADFFMEKVPLSRSITNPHKRLQHLAGRYLLQWLFPDFPIHLIQIADTRKPFLANETHHFSITHSGNYAAAIVSTNRQVGIDIELHTERIHRVSHKFLNEYEEQIAPPKPSIYPTLIWSVKEAMYKWNSLGEIDFQEHLQITKTPESLNSSGMIDAYISKPKPSHLTLEYKIWENLVMAWVCQ